MLSDLTEVSSEDPGRQMPGRSEKRQYVWGRSCDYGKDSQTAKYLKDEADD